MEICNGDYGSHISKLMESIENGKSNAWRSMKILYSKNHREININNNDYNDPAQLTSQQVAIPQRLYSFETEFTCTPYYAVSFWRQLRVLLKRNTIRLFRDKVTSLCF